MKKLSINLIRSILDSIGSAAVLTDPHNSIIYINSQYSLITGYSLTEVLGRKPNIVSSGKQTAQFYQNLWASLHSTGYWEGEIWNRKKSGELFSEWISISVIKDQKGEVIYHLGIFSDITSKKIKEEKINHYAYYDLLTHLPNRRFFMESLKQFISLSKRNKSKLAVVFIDLNKFKSINDLLGHTAGDKYLLEVSKLIRRRLRKSDILSRFGGDEFVILLPHINDMKDLSKLSHKLINYLHKATVSIGKKSFPVSISLGYAIYPDDALKATQLIECADARMYLDKAKSSQDSANTSFSQWLFSSTF